MKKPFSGIIYSSLLLLTAVILGSGCDKTPKDDSVVTVPSIVTYGLISNVSQTGAVSGGVVTNANGGVIANGVCWSATNALPTVNDSKTVDTVGTSGFASTITGLTGGTSYYVRAYATNSNGTGYGAVITFKTPTTPGILRATVTTLAGSTSGAYGYTDATGNAALFNGPQYIAYNPNNGNLFVSDVLNNVIRTVVPSTGQVSSYTQSTLGFSNGPLSSATFYSPASIAFDAQNNTYVADLGNNAIRKITPGGTVTTFAGSGLYGYADGTGTAATFAAPQGLAVDASGNLYVADRANNLIRKITSAGVVSTFCGGVASIASSQQKLPGYVDGSNGANSLFNRPTSLALDTKGGLFVADVNNRAVRDVNLSTAATSTVVGNNVQKLLLGSPTAVTSDSKGNLFIVDQGGRILEVTTDNILYVLAGAANTTAFADGVGSAARFNTPTGIAVDANGVVYVADFGNNCIRKLVIKVQ